MCIKWYARMYETQAGIKIARRNINNLRYADNTTCMVAESEEDLKSFLMKVKEENEKDQSILKEINPEYSLDRLMLKLKLQHLAT